MIRYFFLTICAILPVIGLCFFIYKRDTNKEPFGLLALLFFCGFFGVIPVLFVELVFEMFFKHIIPISETSSFILTFINVFISVALVEEGLKWIITKVFGYDNKEFDEVYDVIVYSVFVSLGFACIENILYVLGNGFGNAIMRALLSVPGHTCFAVIMGYFFAQAKINVINKRKANASLNLFFSILCPALAHTMYDALLMHFVNLVSFAQNNVSFGHLFYLLLFFLFDIIMVVICFITVDKISKVQKNLNQSIQNGTVYSDHGFVAVNKNADIHFCPVCGKPAEQGNFCVYCGCKLR